MNNELVAMLDYFERDRGLDRDVVTQAIEEALISAARRAVGPANGLRVTLDPKTGDINAIAELEVVERVVDPNKEIAITQVQRTVPDVNIGDMVDWEVTPRNFGRIAAQTAKQGIMQRLRQAQKSQIREEYSERVGEILYGGITRYEKGDIIIDFQGAEGVLRHQDRVPNEDYQVGDHICCVLIEVNMERQGPILVVSRSAPAVIQQLFEREVAEIAEGIVTIKAVAREPGYRSKIAVFSNDSKVDPVGACVGVRGSRVKAIVRELNGEKVDIVRWDDDNSTFISNALQPAEVRKIEIDESTGIVNILVDPDQLSLTIGKRGQNVRLTAKLTGWKIEVQRIEDKQEANFEEQVAKAIANLAGLLNIDEVMAEILIQNGYASSEGLAAADEADLAAIEGVGEETAQAIKQAVANLPIEPAEEEAPAAEEEAPAAEEEAPAAEEETPAAEEETPAAEEETPAAEEETPAAEEEAPAAEEEAPAAEEKTPAAEEEAPAAAVATDESDIEQQNQ